MIKEFTKKKLIELYFSILENTLYSLGKTNIISNYNIRLPIRVSHWYKKNYESNNISFLDLLIEKKWNTVDLGSNVGVYSIILSNLVGNQGHVYAFEPTKSTFIHLKNTVKWNKNQNITLENMAVGETESEMLFYFKIESGAVSNSLISYKDNSGDHYKVKVVPLDNYVNGKKVNINFIKIDVEGSEIDVLKGAINILEKQRPILLLAVHPLIIQENQQTHGELYEILEKLNYKIYYEGTFITKESFNLLINLFDVFCIPKESTKNSVFRIL